MTRSVDGAEMRRRELGLLLDAARADPGRGARAVLVSGEAGIGKTHLVRTAAQRLADEGMAVAWGRADPVERNLPYAALTQALATFPGGSIRPAWPDGAQGGDTVRHEITLSVGRLLEERCAEGPVTVVIDDLHHADADTLALLGVLTRRLAGQPITWVFTARAHLADPAPGLTALLYGLREDQRLDEVPLAALDHRSLARLVGETVGTPIDDATRDAIVRRASGNPFFAIQLALSAGAAPSRRAALLERVLPLGEVARQVGRVAAVFGDLDLDQLDLLAGHVDGDRAAVQEAFDRLVRADLLRARGPRYEFSHDLIRETLYEDLAPAERRRLHGTAAAVLLEQRARGEAVDVVELARHLSLASPGPDAAAVDALRDAGDALLPSSPRSAALRYRQAIGYLPEPGGGNLHVRLARALHRAGDPDEVVRVCRVGLDVAGATARPALTRYLSAALADLGDLGGALEVVDAEIAAAGASSVLLNTRSLLHRLLDDFPAAAEDIDGAAALARSDRDRLGVLLQRFNLAVDVGSLSGAGPALDELERVLPAFDPETRLLAHIHATAACVGLGEVGRGVGHLAAADALAAGGVLDVDWPSTFGARVAVLVAQGRWDEALTSYEHGAAELTSGLRLLVRNNVITAVTDIVSARRDSEGLRRLASQIVPLTPRSRRLLAITNAAVHAAVGRYPDAIAELEDALAGVPRHSQVDMYLTLAAASIHHLFDRDDAARELVERFRESAAVVATPWTAVLERLLAVIADDDVGAGLEGLRLAREHGNIRYEPEFQLELGRLGVDPAEHLVAAFHRFNELGDDVHLVRVEAQMRRLGIRVPNRRRVGRFALTDAEQRVADLVAEGLSNKAVGERLAYSAKTVETYLSRVYAKTGCRNRVELARFVRS